MWLLLRAGVALAEILPNFITLVLTSIITLVIIQPIAAKRSDRVSGSAVTAETVP